jgi:hypothetical protein
MNCHIGRWTVIEALVDHATPLRHRPAVAAPGNA